MKTVDDVENQLLLDRLAFGSCFWRVANGKKVRVPPWEVSFDEHGRLRGADDRSEIQSSDSASEESSNGT